MEIEAYTGPQPEPVSLRGESVKHKKVVKPRKPIAKAAADSPSIRPDEADQQAAIVEDLLSPPSITGFAWSIGGHAILLVILGFWYFAPIVSKTKVLDTRLAGSEFGDPAGDQLKGGLGMDTPLAMPESPATPEPREAERTFTSLPISEIKPPVARKAEASGAAVGGSGAGGKAGQAGDGDGFGIAKFGQGGENINGVDVKVGDPQFTLLWDSRADIDIHVIEPGGSEIFWENRNGKDGGELDVDDVDGFGPENINYVQGKGPRGTYKWFVHYYGGLGGIAQNTKWRVRVKYAGKTEVINGKFRRIGEKSEVRKLVLNASNPSADVAKPENKATSEVRKEMSRPSPLTAVASGGAVVFSPSGGGFSVALPKDPKAGRKEWESAIGAIVIQTYTVEDNDGGMSVAVIDYPASALAKIEPAKLLDELAIKVVTENKGKLQSQGKITLQGSNGRETEFTLPESMVAGGGAGRSRLYLVGSRVLMLSAIGTKSFLESSDAVDFFKSFAITESK